MSKLQLKTIQTLSDDDRLALADLIISFYKLSTTDKYLLEKTVKGPAFDIVLNYCENQTIQSASYFHYTKCLTPFSKRPLPVVHFGLSMKQPHFKGNVIWKSGSWYARKRMGIFYPLKSAVGLSMIQNPRVLENFTKLFKTNFPFSFEQNESIESFVFDYFKSRSSDFNLTKDFCFIDESLQELDITTMWEKLFKSKNERINQLLFDKGIFVQRGDRIIKTNKMFIACGYRALFKLN